MKLRRHAAISSSALPSSWFGAFAIGMTSATALAAEIHDQVRSDRRLGRNVVGGGRRRNSRKLKVARTAASSSALTAKCAGPSVVGLTIQEPRVIGVVANNVWAWRNGQQVNEMTAQYFINYNLPEGWYPRAGI
jgi:hypothetical protein